MARRHHLHELERVAAPRWLSVTDTWGKLIESQALPHGADLKAAMVTTLAGYAAAGLNLEEYSSRSALAFINRGKDRYMILIRPTDPGRLVAFNSLSIEGTERR